MKAMLIISANKRVEGRMFGEHYKDLAVLNIKGKGTNDLTKKAERIADEFLKRNGLERDEFGYAFQINYNKEFPLLKFATYGKYGLSGDYSQLPEYIAEAKKYVILNK